MLSRLNAYLLGIVIIAFGTSGFLANAEGSVQIPGLLIISILLLVLPGVVVALGWTNHQFTRLESLSFVIIPLIAVNYIFSIKLGMPVGYQDVQSNITHYFQWFDSNGAILFQNVAAINLNFVGNWIIYRYLNELCNLDIVTLSLVTPPILNLVLTMTAYLLVSRLCSHKVALLATVLYGWDYTVLLYGHEIRTQTAGIILLFSVLSLLLIFTSSKRRTVNPQESIIVLVVLAGLSTIAFVSIFDTMLVLVTLVFAAAVLVPFVFRWKQSEPLAISAPTIFIFFAFVFFYTAYVTGGFATVFGGFVLQYYGMFARTSASITVSTGQTLYGPFLQFATYAIWATFLIFAIWIFWDVMKHRKTVQAIVFIALGSLLIFELLDNVAGSLSPGRIYTVAFILMAAILSFGLFKLQRKYASSNYRHAVQALVLAIILLQVVAVAKLPSYVIGGVSPIRGDESVDHVPYWSSGIPQNAVASYLSNYAANQRLHPEMLIDNYKFQQTALANNLTYVGNTGNLSTNPSTTQLPLRTGDLIVLEDKFNGDGDYTFRNLLPASNAYQGSSAIYANGDYIIYEAP